MSNESKELILEKMYMDMEQRINDKLETAMYSFWGAMVTLNGILMGVFSLLISLNDNICNNILIPFLSLTTIPTFLILLNYYFLRRLNIIMINLNSARKKSEATYQNKKKKANKYAIYYNIFQQYTETPSFLCTIGAIAYVWYIVYKMFHTV